MHATVVHGFETSAPLEAGFLRVRLENTGKQSERVTLSLPSDLVEQQIELPPSSRKEIPLITTDAGLIVVRAGDAELLRRDVPPSFPDDIVLVISGRETGLRNLTREAPPLPAGSGIYQQTAQSLPATAGAVRVLRTRPEDLPASVWGYRMLGRRLLVVAHPGGYDAMTPAQREALRVTATHLADLVLVSEGRADAFQGTPFESLLPGKAVSVSSYAEWLAHFPGASADPSALTVFRPEDDAVTSQTTMDGLPLVVQSDRHGPTVTYLPFDYSAPPLRSWNSRPFWYSLIGTTRPGREPAVQAFAAMILEWEQKRLARVPPPPLQLGLAAAVLALGYMAAVFGARRLRDQPIAYASWLIGPALLALAFGVAVALGLFMRTRTTGILETGVVSPVGKNAMVRTGQIAISGPGSVRNLAAGSPHALLQAPRGESALLHRVRLVSQAPPVIGEVVMERTGRVTFQTHQILPVEGSLEVAASPIVAGMSDYEIRLANRTGLPLRDLRIFLGGRYATLDNLTAGATTETEVKLRQTSTPPAGLLGQVAPSTVLSRDEALVDLAARASQGQFAAGTTGLAVARMDLPPLFPGTEEVIHYLVVPVRAR